MKEYKIKISVSNISNINIEWFQWTKCWATPTKPPKYKNWMRNSKKYEINLQSLEETQDTLQKRHFGKIHVEKIHFWKIQIHRKYQTNIQVYNDCNDKVSMLRKILQVVNLKCTSVKYKYIENAKYRMYKYKMTAMNKVSV